MSNTCSSTMHEQPELLQENTKLSSEKHSIQKYHSKERKSLLARLHQMEIALDEVTAEKENIIKAKCQEILDLKAQMESMEKQMQSNKKFIDEQASEREQEREEFMKEISKMQNFVHEKEKIQSNEAKLIKEIENLEQLLRARIDDHKIAMSKKDEIEKELRHSLDKIRDLRDVIEELEKQLETKSKTIRELQHKLSTIAESLAVYEKNNSIVSPIIEEHKPPSTNSDSTEKLRNLQEQLESQNQELVQMSQNETLLRELRGQIHFLEAKVDQRTRHLESMFLMSSSTSPVHSDDTSHSESQEGESLHIPCEDGWQMSPRSVHWIEIRRLEEKISRLTNIEEDVMRKNKDLESQLKRLMLIQQEHQHENTMLREKLSDQLLQISALKSHIEEQKHRFPGPQLNHAANEKIEELHEALEVQTEKNKKILSELEESQIIITSLQNEIHRKDTVIDSLQKSASRLAKQNLAYDGKTKSDTYFEEESLPTCIKLMLLEKNEHIDSLTHELECLQEEIDKLKSGDKNACDSPAVEDLKKELGDKENDFFTIESKNKDLELQVEKLNAELDDLKEKYAKVQEELESEKIQVETLCDEMGNLAKINIENPGNMSASTISDNNLQKIYNAKLSSKLEKYECNLKEKNFEILMLKATITKLETSLRVAEKNLELEQVQVETLLQEMGNLTSYQKQLEQDFNTVQNMMQQKERELATLQEETETQVKLEAEIESLEQILSDQKCLEQNLKQKIEELESALNCNRMDLKKKSDSWELEFEKTLLNHSTEVQGYKKQIDILQRNLTFANDLDDIEISKIQQEIVEAAQAFKQCTEENKKPFSDIVFAILKKAINHKTNILKEKHETEVKQINEKWTDKLKDELNSNTKELNLRFEEYKEESQKKISEALSKDEYWQQRLNEMETSLNDKILIKINEKEKFLTDVHNKELSFIQDNFNLKMKEKDDFIEKLKQDYKMQFEIIKQNYDKEKEILVEKMDAKAKLVKEELKTYYDTQIKQLRISYENNAEKLQSEFNLKLENEKSLLQTKHKEELLDLYKYFKTRWAEEIKKIHLFQTEQLKKIRNFDEQNFEAAYNNLISSYQSKLKTIEEKELQISKETELISVRNKDELLQLQKDLEEKFHIEKTEILESKEKELLDIKNDLEKKYCLLLEEKVSKLKELHKNELEQLRQELQFKYEKQLESQLNIYDKEMKRREETYNQQIEEVNQLLKDASRISMRNVRSESSSNRTTPSSEMTSSDETETCSSCKEDILPKNRHLLANKIHRRSKQVLALIQSSRTSSLENEVHHWLEEREWVINKLHNFFSGKTTKYTNLQQVIDHFAKPLSLKILITDLLDEIENARAENVDHKNEEIKLHEQISRLKQKLNDQSIEIHKLYNHSYQMTKSNDLEHIIPPYVDEINAVENLSTLASTNEIIQDNELYNMSNGKQLASSGIEVLRSADTKRSLDHFFSTSPDIGEAYISYNKDNIQKNEIVLPHISTEDIKWPEGKSSPMQITPRPESIVSSSPIMWTAPLSNTKLDNEMKTKLHVLYWKYRRSHSYHRSLVFQKNYLLMLLKGFMKTEKLTLNWLHHLNNTELLQIIPTHDVSFINESKIIRGRSLFRATVFALIAIHRMNFFVKHWRERALVPSSHIVNNEVHSILQMHPFLATEVMLSKYQLSSNSVSKATSYAENPNQYATNIRYEEQHFSQSQMKEYVKRLEELHKQLGLDKLD